MLRTTHHATVQADTLRAAEGAPRLHATSHRGCPPPVASVNIYGSLISCPRYVDTLRASARPPASGQCPPVSYTLRASARPHASRRWPVFASRSIYHTCSIHVLCFPPAGTPRARVAACSQHRSTSRSQRGSPACSPHRSIACSLHCSSARSRHHGDAPPHDRSSACSYHCC